MPNELLVFARGFVWDDVLIGDTWEGRWYADLGTEYSRRPCELVTLPNNWAAPTEWM